MREIFSLARCAVVLGAVCGAAHAASGEFDLARWDSVLSDVRTTARAGGVSDAVIDAALKSPAFHPAIIKSDRNQAEFKLTLDQYLGRTVTKSRIDQGRRMREKYASNLARVNANSGVPPHVILAFWGLESNYGTFKAAYKLTDAFLTLIYDGRRETFFKKQLIALMQIADKNDLDISAIRGSWAGAMGHFQFIPTTLAQYGADGDGDGRIDIINNIPDAMASAGNYLGKLGWDSSQRIVRRVMLPAGFDMSLADGKTKKDLAKWAAMGIVNPDGTPIPMADMTAGLVADGRAAADTADAENAVDTDVAPTRVVYGYLTYPNFYRIKNWNNSNWYAIAIANLADELK